MAEKIEKDILDISTPWEGYSGEFVEKFIKKLFGERLGYLDKTSDETGKATVRGFASVDSYNEWAADPDNKQSLILTQIEFYEQTGSADYTLAARITQQPASTVVKGASNIVKFTYNSYYGSDSADLDSEPGYARVIINSTVVDALSMSLPAGGQEFSIDLGPYLTQETNSVQLTIGNAHGKSRQWTFTLDTREIILAIDDSYDESSVRDAGWLLRVACRGTSAEVHLIIDDDPLTEQLATINNSTYDFIIDAADALAYGSHTIKLYAINAEYGITTDVITTSFIKRGLSSPSVCIGKDTARKAKLYGTASIPYYFYFPTGNPGDIVTVNFVVLDKSGTALSSVTSQQVQLLDDLTSGMQEWRLTLGDNAYLGTIVPTIQVGTASTSFELEVITAGVTLEAASECKVHLSAAGRTNADSDAEDWHSEYGGVRTCTVVRSDNFDLIGDNGFHNDGFHIKAGKSITLSGLSPFATDFGVNAEASAARTGKTIEFEFETGNCTNIDAQIIRCLNDGVGFVVYANRVELHCAAGEIHTLYCDEQRVRVGFCIDGQTTTCVNDTGNSEQGSTTTYANIAYMYVNGVIVRMMNYDTSEWRQTTPQEVVIGSPDCDVILYTVRVYDKSLNYRQMIDNYAYDTPDLEAKIAIAKRNDVLDSAGAVSLAKVLTALPNTPYIIWEMKQLPTSKNDPRTCDKTVFVNPQWNEELGYARASFTAGAHEINGDGTSSNNYPLPYKNWAETFEFNSDNAWVVNLPEGDVVITKFSITPGVEAAETDFVHKVNFASCEGIFNMLAMNVYQDILVAVATAASGYPSILTARQAEQDAAGLDITFRQSLSGFPEIGFRRTFDNAGNPTVSFLSLYNFINNKYSPSMFGYSKKSDKNQIWEVDDNINFFMSHLDEAKWNDGFDSLTTTLYYARVPKKSLVTGEKLGIAGSSDQVSQANVETAALRRFHNWIQSCNPTVAERYRLRYGNYRKLSIAEDGYEQYTYGEEVFTTDTPAYRYAKFATEYSKYLNKWSAIFYFIFLTYHLGTDSMDKNMSIACDDVTVDNANWLVFIRDTDTINLFNNSGLLRWMFFHEWGDSFDATTGQTGTVLGETYDATTGTYTATTSAGTPIFNGRLSGLWDCVAKVWEADIKTMYVAMRSGGLNASTLFAKYKEYWSHWCEALYNVDGLGYANTGNFSMAYGDKLELTRYFYKYRQRYWDSKCATGESSSNVLMLRLWKRGAGVALRHYCPIYASLNWGSGGVKSQRNIEAGSPAYFENGITASGANEVTFSIYDADLLTEISTYTVGADGTTTEKGLEGLGQIDIQTNLPKCRRLKRLILAHTADTPNTQLSNSGFDLSACTMLKEVVVTYNTSLTRAVTIASEMIERIDFRGTPIVGITLPSTDSLTEMRLPATIQRLRLSGLSKLSTFTIEGADSMTQVDISGCPGVNSQIIIEACLNRENRILAAVEIDGVAWTNFSVDHLLYLAQIGAKLSGTINLATSSSSTINYEQKAVLMQAFGDIDDPDNDLYVIYTTRNISALHITGSSYIYKAGKYEYKAVPSPASANYFTPIKWSIEDETYATINENTGVLTLKNDATVGEPTAVITATTTRLSDGVAISISKTIGFYKRAVRVGDFAYADGTFDDVLDRNKTVVGIVYQIDEAEDGLIRIVGRHRPGTATWGINTQSNPTGDIPTLKNYTNYNGSTSYVPENSDWESLYLTPGGDAFREFTAGSFSDWDGRGNTQKIIAYRNEMLLLADLDIPNSLAELDEKYNEFAADSNSEDYILRLYYYRAASICNFYEPSVMEGEVLADAYKQGNWYLPSEGELSRLYWYHRKGYTIPDTEPEYDHSIPIFAKPRNLVDNNGDTLFPQIPNSWHWSSTEYNYQTSWYIGFGSGSACYNHRYYHHYVVPVAAIEKSKV